MIDIRPQIVGAFQGLTVKVKDDPVLFLLGSLVASIISFFLIRQISEYDIWFHLTVGNEILNSGALPLVDKFSLLNIGRKYHDSQWLFQVVAAAGYRFAGVWWLHTLQIVVWGLAFRFVYRACRRWSSAVISWLLVFVVALACEDRFSIRPEIVTALMMSLFYYWLQQEKYRSLAGIVALSVMQIIWTNCHGVFVLGPFIVGCYLFESVLKEWRNKQFVASTQLAILFAAVSLSCLVTPNGLDTLKFVWLLLVEVSPASPKFFKSIYDLKPPLGAVSRATVAFWFYYALLAGFIVTFVTMICSQVKKVPVARTVIVVAMLCTSMLGVRNMPLFALVAAPLIAEYLLLLKTALHRRASVIGTGLVVLAATFIWSPRPAWQQFTTLTRYKFGFGLSPDYVPLGLPKLLDSLNFIEPVFNTQALGGFYEFHGYPRRIPFFDGRFEAYQPETLTSVYEAAANATVQPAAWDKLLRQYDFRGLLIENGTADAAGLLPSIARDPQWRLVYLDYAASFWLRADYPRQPPLVTVADIITLTENVKSYPNVENIFLFLEKADIFPELRLKLIERASQRWENQFTLKNLGLLQMQSGNLEGAERTFNRLLIKSPRSRSTIVTLAQIALERGDKVTAEKYLLKGLGFYPEDAALRENLEVVRQSAQP